MPRTCLTAMIVSNLATAIEVEALVVVVATVGMLTGEDFLLSSVSFWAVFSDICVTVNLCSVLLMLR